MNFNKSTEYALRIICFMAVKENDIFTTTELHEPLQIPFRYLRKLMISLSKSGIIESIQGNKGGYKIGKPLSEISLFDVVKTMDDDFAKNECFFGFEKCALSSPCSMHLKWVEIRDQIHSVLKNTTLDNLNSENRLILL